VSVKRLTLIIGNSRRNISSEELSSLNASGCIERNQEGQIKWEEKRTVRFLMPEIKLRGRSCGLGAYLLVAAANKELWALLMLSQIGVKRLPHATRFRKARHNGIHPPKSGPVWQYQP